MPSFARLRGTLHTDKNGHFKLKTIVPGNYPGETTGKHIHVVANAKGFKEWKFEFLFEGWVSQSLRKEILKNKDAIILDLKEKEGIAGPLQQEYHCQQTNNDLHKVIGCYHKSN